MALLRGAWASALASLCLNLSSVTWEWRLHRCSLGRLGRGLSRTRAAGCGLRWPPVDTQQTPAGWELLRVVRWLRRV